MFRPHERRVTPPFREGENLSLFPRQKLHLHTQGELEAYGAGGAAGAAVGAVPAFIAEGYFRPITIFQMPENKHLKLLTRWFAPVL